ncbi:uncharacterized protein LOC110452102 [Mizuhopecten yessoensis]|uniref:uncharacterized protein LOC110452102 n=1 Tax=Mizuhopecten yessoensis TaxID=6573 RepID=UPI000B45744B|nr:uncharacterized protein LOC110452102 [Mizuhopecten yessoensis]
MQLQLVVNQDLMLIHAYTGWPGATHNARVYSNSAFPCDAQRLFLPNHYLLADSAFPLSDNIVTSFRQRLNSNVRFNKVVSSVGQSVERDIGHMKGRFRRLREITLSDPSDICAMIMAGCILHNLCIVNEPDVINDYIEPDAHQPVNNLVYAGVNPNAGVARRNLLLELLP